MTTIRQALKTLVGLKSVGGVNRHLGFDQTAEWKRAWEAARTALAEQPATQGEDVLAQIRAIVDEWDETGRGPGIKLNEISYILGTPPGKPTPLTDAQLVEHLHARGWPVALSDAPMLREAAAALAGEPSDASTLRALRRAAVALAHAANSSPNNSVYDQAYEEVSDAILALRTKEASK